MPTAPAKPGKERHEAPRPCSQQTGDSRSERKNVQSCCSETAHLRALVSRKLVQPRLQPG